MAQLTSVGRNFVQVTLAEITNEDSIQTLMKLNDTMEDAYKRKKCVGKMWFDLDQTYATDEMYLRVYAQRLETDEEYHKRLAGTADETTLRELYHILEKKFGGDH